MLLIEYKKLEIVENISKLHAKIKHEENSLACNSLQLQKAKDELKFETEKELGFRTRIHNLKKIELTSAEKEFTLLTEKFNSLVDEKINLENKIKKTI